MLDTYTPHNIQLYIYKLHINYMHGAQYHFYGMTYRELQLLAVHFTATIIDVNLTTLNETNTLDNSVLCVQKHLMW